MRIEVLDRGWVELQDMLGDDLAIVNAARVSYLGESKGPERDRKLLRYLLTHDHGTPFEMAVFKFRVKTPEVVFRQWIRHRIGSFNVQSRRYTEVEDDDLHTPERWRLQDTANRQGSKGELGADASRVLFDELAEVYARCRDAYRRALAAGVAREQARLFLPGFAVYSTFVWTVNARSLMNFLRLRLDAHAQWEIRQYARAVGQIFKTKLPWTAEIFAEKEGIVWD
jgi:thymidylate synthase (FAD)